MERGPQSLLPEGTVVYKYNFIYHAIRRTTINHAYVSRLVFIYDPKDELWATELVRDIWKRDIYRHPHCTLFVLLYKKLGI